MQMVKVLVLGRITLRSFRAIPGLGDAAASILSLETGVGASNCYTVAESLLLRWLGHHWRHASPAAAARLTTFDAQLADGHVFAACLLSHCPFLAVKDAEATEPPGSCLNHLYPRAEIGRAHV